MQVVRPVELDDLDQLLALTELSSFGLTTLPKNRDLLARRVKQSVRAMQHLDDDTLRGQAYLFVMEDLPSGRVVGTSGVVSKVGGFEPFYTYRIEVEVRESKTLGIRKEHHVLHLLKEHDGPSEIGSLFLQPDFRSGGLGRVLSLSRFLFLAEHPRLFDQEVIAEMRGVIDDQGRSPFWEALGRHFFDLEYPKADMLSMANKDFIGDLMPEQPIYITLLPASAQEVVAQVHPETRPARALLEGEGFRFEDQVDIFEAGPVLHCQRDAIRAVANSRTAVVREIEPPAADEPQRPRFVIGLLGAAFRACGGHVEPVAGGIRLDAPAAEALRVSAGDTVRYVELHPAK